MPWRLTNHCYVCLHRMVVWVYCAVISFIMNFILPISTFARFRVCNLCREQTCLFLSLHNHQHTYILNFYSSKTCSTVRKFAQFGNCVTTLLQLWNCVPACAQFQRSGTNQGTKAAFTQLCFQRKNEHLVTVLAIRLHTNNENAYLKWRLLNPETLSGDLENEYLKNG